MVQWNIVISCDMAACLYQAYGLLQTEGVGWYVFERHLQSIVLSRIACTPLSCSQLFKDSPSLKYSLFLSEWHFSSFLKRNKCPFRI